MHLPPTSPAIDAGVGTIMPSYSSWNGLKCSANKYLLTDVLKDELGFEGFLISDYNAIDQIDRDYKAAVEKFVNAGMDMAMVPTTYRKFIETLKELVEEGRVPDVADRRRGDAHPARQVRDGAAGQRPRRNWPTGACTAQFGSAEHRAVARAGGPASRWCC